VIFDFYQSVYLEQVSEAAFMGRVIRVQARSGLNFKGVFHVEKSG
jgi:hypothetical protein